MEHITTPSDTSEKSDYTEDSYIGSGLVEKSLEYCKQHNISPLPDGGGKFAHITEEKVERWAKEAAKNISDILEIR